MNTSTQCGARRATRWLAAVVICALAGCGEEAGPGGASPATDSPGGAATKQQAKQPGPLGLAAGKIVYKRTGVPEGTITVWFQDHGATVVYLEDTRHRKLRNHKKIIWRDGQTTLFDYETKQTSTHKLRVKATELDWNASISEENLARVGFEKQGTETVAGLACQVWVNPRIRLKAWVHQHLRVKEVNQMERGGYTEEAVSFEPLDAIPTEAFALPGS